MYKEIEVFNGQTLKDIAMRRYGCYEGKFLIIQDNPGLGLSSELAHGQKLKIRTEVPQLTDTNLRVVQYYNDNNIDVNSGYAPETAQIGQFMPDQFTEDFVTE